MNPPGVKWLASLPMLNAENLRNGYFIYTGEIENVNNVCVQIREVTEGFGMAVCATNAGDKMEYYDPYSDSFETIDYMPTIDTAQAIIDRSGLPLTALALKHWSPTKSAIGAKFSPV